MKVAVPNASPKKFVEGTITISRPGATLLVNELILTDQGRQALTSGSKGITKGAKENYGPPSALKKSLAPA